MGDETFNGIDFIHSNNLGFINVTNLKINQTSGNPTVGMINNIFLMNNSTLSLDSLILRYYWLIIFNLNYFSINVNLVISSNAQSNVSVSNCIFANITIGILSFNYVENYNYLNTIIIVKNILMINNVILCGMSFSDISNNSWNITFDNIQIIGNQALNSIIYLGGLMEPIIVISSINFANNIINLGI